MLQIASAREMRGCDEEAITGYGIPGIVLMENAARGTADAMQNYIPDLHLKQTLIVCGKGNNGGDGFALARHLVERGCTVTVAALSHLKQLTGDARINADIIRKMVRSDSSGTLSLITSATRAKLEQLSRADVIVDAILGTGFKGKLKPKIASIVEWMNGQTAVRVAIDIPSGVDADTGNAEGTTFHADYTYTMGLVKRGLLFSPGRDASGKVICIDIQIPPEVFRRSKIKTFLVTESAVRSVVPKRPLDAHKYQVGKVFVLAGSTGLTGAATLTSMSALRSGAGAVVLGIPESLNLMMEKKLTEVMTLPLVDNGSGVLHVSAWEKIKQQCEWADIIAAGPGLSRTDDVKEIIVRLVKKIDKPIVLDADALNVLSGQDTLFARRTSPVIVTPHTGEFSRLSGISGQEIATERIDIARRYARMRKITLLLKGGPSIIASKNGNIYINQTGNPGMATAGSGDVLTGAIAGLWAQGLTDEAAAYCGAYLHGAAGDQAMKKYGERAMTAGDIQEELLKVIKGTIG
jgi:ADP-dependent NAD(P)H-hydrate dehydratase / NAD(P)H-hydrate epimerase